MAHDHHPFPQTFGPGGPDVILPEHLQHHGTHHPHRHTADQQPQHRAGYQDHHQVPQRVLGPADHSHRGSPAKPEDRVDHHQDGDKELGGGNEKDGDAASDIVAGGILPQGGIDTDGQPEEEGHQQGDKTEFQGRDAAREYFFSHRPLVIQGAPKIAVQQYAAYPADILYVHRHVHPQLTRNLLPVEPCRAILAQHDGYDIPREKTHGKKDDGAEKKEGGDDKQQSPDDISTHWVPSFESKILQFQ